MVVASKVEPVTADECNERARACAANAAIAPVEAVKQEFLTLAAQWRAMAVRQIFIGQIARPAEAVDQLGGQPVPLL